MESGRCPVCGLAYQSRSVHSSRSRHDKTVSTSVFVSPIHSSVTSHRYQRSIRAGYQWLTCLALTDFRRSRHSAILPHRTEFLSSAEAAWAAHQWPFIPDRVGQSAADALRRYADALRAGGGSNMTRIRLLPHRGHRSRLSSPDNGNPRPRVQTNVSMSNSRR
jgi:hypothetical protein